MTWGYRVRRELGQEEGALLQSRVSLLGCSLLVFPSQRWQPPPYVSCFPGSSRVPARLYVAVRVWAYMATCIL